MGSSWLSLSAGLKRRTIVEGKNLRIGHMFYETRMKESKKLINWGRNEERRMAEYMYSDWRKLEGTKLFYIWTTLVEPEQSLVDSLDVFIRGEKTSMQKSILCVGKSYYFHLLF